MFSISFPGLPIQTCQTVTYYLVLSSGKLSISNHTLFITKLTQEKLLMAWKPCARNLSPNGAE